MRIKPEERLNEITLRKERRVIEKARITIIKSVR